MDILQTDIKFLKGVGPMRAKWLGDELQIFTLRDLLYHFPYKYIDRSVVHRVADLMDGMPYVQLKGQIVAKNVEGAGRIYSTPPHRNGTHSSPTARGRWNLSGSGVSS